MRWRAGSEQTWTDGNDLFHPLKGSGNDIIDKVREFVIASPIGLQLGCVIVDADVGVGAG